MYSKRVKLSITSKFTEFHSSQKIFGFICYQILDIFGEEKLVSVLESLKNDERTLKISSLLPYRSILKPLYIGKSFSIHDVYEATKKFKKAKYLHENVLSEISWEDYPENVINKLASGEFKTSNGIIYPTAYEIGRIDKTLEVKLGNNPNSSDQKAPFSIEAFSVSKDFYLQFFIETDVSEIEELFDNLTHMKLGMMKDRGLNVFEIAELEEFEQEETSTAVLLSQYIPDDFEDEVDSNKSFFKVGISKYRPESRIQQDNATYDEVRYIEEGAYLKLKKPEIGKIFIRRSGTPNIYHYGKAYMYYLSEVK